MAALSVVVFSIAASGCVGPDPGSSGTQSTVVDINLRAEARTLAARVTLA